MADDLWSRYASQLPAGASGKDPIVGQTEWGTSVYQSPTGNKYWAPIDEMGAPQQRGSVARALVEQASSQPIMDTVGSVAKALAGGVWGAIEAPARAWRGEPVTYGDVWDTAGMAQLGAAAMPAPRGALRSGSVRNADDATSYIRRSQLPDTPDNGVGYSMFVRGGPDDLDSISSYGPYSWTATSAGSVPVESIQGDIVRAIRRDRMNDQYGSTAAALAREANPSDIVNSAGLWDNPELVERIYEDILGPRGISKVQTSDGLLLFDPSLAERYLP